MRFDYWTVHVIPRPMGITRIGVGVIVADPASGQTRYRFRNDTNRVFREFDLSQAIHSALSQFEKELQQYVESAEPLGLDGTLTLNGYLSIAASHWMNLIRVGRVQSMDAASIDNAVDRLFTLLIGDAPHSQPLRTVRHIRSLVRDAYKSFPRLSESTIEPTSVTVAHRGLDLNIAVVDRNRVLELNQAFNFQAVDANATLRGIDTWTLKIEKLRSTGGVLAAGSSCELSLPHDVAVVAVHDEPRGSSQRKAFSEFTIFCKEADIKLIPDVRIKNHASELENRLVG